MFPNPHLGGDLTTRRLRHSQFSHFRDGSRGLADVSGELSATLTEVSQFFELDVRFAVRSEVLSIAIRR